jgi:two-component system response regulator RegA
MPAEEIKQADGPGAAAADINSAPTLPQDRSLLILDDDKPFLGRLTRAMDMRLGDGNGLDVISKLKASRPDARGIILTGYGNIATAVTAVKLGAFDYLAKPADADEIYHALMATQLDKPDAQENPMSADRVRWEHIQRVFESCDRNVSETARRLNMHRRTLQRILAKRAPR